MGKKLTKSGKLDLILSELSELKAEIKKLQKHQVTAANQSVKAISRSVRNRRPKKTPRRTGAVTKPAANVEPSKPVLVEAPLAPTIDKMKNSTATNKKPDLRRPESTS